jgi:hypothetical protein
MRRQAASAANADDAAVWRWFSDLVEEHRIRWIFDKGGWLVSVDHRHLSTEKTFDHAIREAKRRFDTGQHFRHRTFDAERAP